MASVVKMRNPAVAWSRGNYLNYCLPCSLPSSRHENDTDRCMRFYFALQPSGRNRPKLQCSVQSYYESEVETLIVEYRTAGYATSCPRGLHAAFACDAVSVG